MVQLSRRSRHQSDLRARDCDQDHRHRPSCLWEVRRRVCLFVVRIVVRSFSVVLRDFADFPECFSALPSRGKTSPRRETHHVRIRIYITHRNSERAPLNCLCDLRSPLAVPSLVFSSSLPLQWTARCCYCWLCSVWCLFPLLVSGAISFFLLRLCLRWCPLSVKLPPRLASRRQDRRLCPVAGLWRPGGGGGGGVFSPLF